MVHSPALGLCGYIRPGSTVAISEKSDCKNSVRKTKHTIEMVELKNDDNKKLWVGANPCLSNKLFEVMLNKNIIDFVGNVTFMKREYSYEINNLKSRFDFYVETNKKNLLLKLKMYLL